MQQKLHRLTRALKALARCNQVITRAKHEKDMLHSICKVIVEDCGYRLAWAGFSAHDRARTVRPVAQYGYEKGYLDTVNITWADTERGRGPTGTAIRTGKPVVCRNMMTDHRFAPWRAEALKRGYASSVAVPLLSGKRSFGALNIYAREPEAFDSHEVELLRELADDVALGISAIRAESERAESEKAVRAEKDRAQTYLDIAGVIILAIDTDGRVSLINKRGCEILGYAQEEIIGKKWFDHFLPERIRGEVKAVFERLVSGRIEPAGYFENPVLTGSGEERLIAWHNTVIRDGAGRITATLSSGEDITERRRLDRLKDEFVRTVSHELRTPLSIAKEGMKIVLDEIAGKMTEQQKSVLTAANRNLERLARIIDDLLDISTIETGRVKLSKETVDLPELIRQVVSSFERKAAGKGLEIRLNVPAHGIIVRADPDKITQVLTNLVDNALKFTEKGHIGIYAAEKGDEVECAVSDTGTGISVENLPKVFSKFQQFGRSAGAGIKGTGLGLSIVRGLVGLHNGSVRVESEQGKGTKFTFTLPK